MAAVSCWTGQRALQPLPSKTTTKKRSLSGYSLPSSLVLERGQILSAQGLPVLKVTKVGKLQVRRFAFSADRRCILITTHALRVNDKVNGLFKSVKGLFGGGKNGSQHGGGHSKDSEPAYYDNGMSLESDPQVKVLPLSQVDRIQRGAYSQRFSVARKSAQEDVSNGAIQAAATQSAADLLHVLDEKDEPACLTIVYRTTGSSTGLETLDLIVAQPAEYEVLLTALEDLTSIDREQRQRYTVNLQVLHEAYTAMNKPWQSPLKPNEWLAICDYISAPFKKNVLLQTFRARLAEIAAEPATQKKQVANNQGNADYDLILEFAAAAALMEEIKAAALPPSNSVLDRLWKDIVSTDPVPAVDFVNSHSNPHPFGRRSGGGGSSSSSSRSGSGGIGGSSGQVELHVPSSENTSVSAVAFLSFLRAQQKEYSTSLEEATGLVQILNQQVTLQDLQQRQSKNKSKRSGGRNGVSNSTTPYSAASPASDRLAKSRFFSFLISDANDLLHPAHARVGAQDMTRPLSHYWIHTSHDTYLASLPSSLHGKSAYAKYHGGSRSGITSPSSKSGQSSASNTGYDICEDQAYTAALLRGVRCLEIDVWDEVDGEDASLNRITPVVARFSPETHNHSHGVSFKVMTSQKARSLPLANVLKAVRTFLDQHPYSLPVLLKLENHCSTRGQEKVAKLLSKTLGDVLVGSGQANLEDPMKLPSPDSIRGKCLVIGKRPKQLKPGSRVYKDDYDVNNDVFNPTPVTDWKTSIAANGSPGDASATTVSTMDEDEYDEDADGGTTTPEGSKRRVVVGFNAQGPIRSSAVDAFYRSPAELLEIAQSVADACALEAKEAEAECKELEQKAEELEQRAAHVTHHSGLSPDEVKRHAARKSTDAAGDSEGDSLSDVVGDNTRSGGGFASTAVTQVDYTLEDEKSEKEEGLEIHEVLPEFVQKSKDQYNKAAMDAMDAAGREAACHSVLREREDALRMAQENLTMSVNRDKNCQDNAKRAASDARMHAEHAFAAKERLERVRELVRDSRDQSSSAGTVVQTALTEAKISEKRAADAEARASRAQVAAENDRIRADVETKTEEDLEAQVNGMHDKCLKAAEKAKQSREKLEQMASKLDRSCQQVLTIEKSKQFRKEYREPQANGSALIHQYQELLEEREKYRNLVKEASEENAAAERTKNTYQQAFEERAYQWKIQADLAAQSRKTADRSMHVADELAERAEEEREAANLRHMARQRAQATVENKDSQRSSVEGQLKEAEKAAADAEKLAQQAKKQADILSKEAEKVRDHTRFEKSVREREAERLEAQAEYDAARQERERLDRIMSEEKRRLDTNSEVCQLAARDVAAESDRERIRRAYQQEAIAAYNDALIVRQQANEASERVKGTAYRAELKRLAAKRAKEYKDKMDALVEIPVELAKMTLLHTCRFSNWQKSLLLSNAHVHSLAQNVLLLMVGNNPGEQKHKLKSFSKDHLVRVFPPWKSLQSRSATNYDPVFAWSLGCQLVSMNMHSSDESVLVADGRFRQNGSCGYVLKPDYLIQNNVTMEDTDQTWTFSVLGGFNLPKPIRKSSVSAPNTFVKVSLYTGSERETRISYKTNPCSHNGLNPYWTSNNRFEFTVPTPCISMICFSVWHADNNHEDFIAAAAFPVSCLREGYRSVALFDANHARIGPYATACLLVKASKR